MMVFYQKAVQKIVLEYNIHIYEFLKCIQKAIIFQFRRKYNYSFCQYILLQYTMHKYWNQKFLLNVLPQEFLQFLQSTIIFHNGR